MIFKYICHRWTSCPSPIIRYDHKSVFTHTPANRCPFRRRRLVSVLFYLLFHIFCIFKKMTKNLLFTLNHAHFSASRAHNIAVGFTLANCSHYLLGIGCTAGLAPAKPYYRYSPQCFYELMLFQGCCYLQRTKMGEVQCE